MLDDNGDPFGFSIDVMDAVAQRAGITLKYRIIPKGKNVVKELIKGSIDVIPGIGISERRKKDFAYTSTLETSRISLFLRSDTIGIKSMADLSDKTVGVVPPTVSQRILSANKTIR